MAKELTFTLGGTDYAAAPQSRPRRNRPSFDGFYGIL